MVFHEYACPPYFSELIEEVHSLSLKGSGSSKPNTWDWTSWIYSARQRGLAKRSNADKATTKLFWHGGCLRFKLEAWAD